MHLMSQCSRTLLRIFSFLGFDGITDVIPTVYETMNTSLQEVDGGGSNVQFINKGLDVYTIVLTPLYQGLEGYIDDPELYY